MAVKARMVVWILLLADCQELNGILDRKPVTYQTVHQTEPNKVPNRDY